jgi:hypothetical protein
MSVSTTAFRRLYAYVSVTELREALISCGVQLSVQLLASGTCACSDNVPVYKLDTFSGRCNFTTEVSNKKALTVNRFLAVGKWADL